MLRIGFVALLAVGCTAPSGTFELLTYNVAGLPEGISGSNPERNHPLIRPKLAAYDLVLLQEDFSYHALLVDPAPLPYVTEPSVPTSRAMGDGLSFLSKFRLAPAEHVQWQDCFGGPTTGASDCLAEKGFAVTTVTLADGVELLVYDHHADAAGSAEDVQARRGNFAQLAADLKTRAAGRAVIVAGDTNLKHTSVDDMETLDQFFAETGLVDACRTLGCPTESIDRVLFRSGDDLTLTPTAWRFADEMVDDDGAPLSDHEAVHVGFAWQVP